MSEEQHQQDENPTTVNDGGAEVVTLLAGLATRETIVQAVRDRMVMDGLSQATTAKQIGIADSTFSQILSGSYKGRLEEPLRKMNAWAGQRAQAQRFNAVIPAFPARIETPTSLKVRDALAYAHIMHDLAVIYGGAGMGKTTELRHYRRNNPNVWLVTANPSIKGVNALLRAIGVAMNLGDRHIYGDILFETLVKAMRGSKGLLVIDEAQHLVKACLEALRALHDATAVDTTAPTMGLVLAGNASVYQNIAKGADNGFAQMTSRIGMRVPLIRPTPEDVAAIARAYRVTGALELKLLTDIAMKPGALRMVVKALRLGATMVADGETLTARHIRSAWNELQGDAEAAHA